MRKAFSEALCAAAAEDERIWLICGDLGYGVLEPFAQRFPDRFVNAGVAEQNMTGVAAGLAHSGKVVFVYSIVNFPVMRCLEQVRNDVCYHNMNVKVVAVGGGLVYGGHGYTHHGAEDLAVMRVLPNMTVLAPGDPVEARLATLAVARRAGPCYLRLGRGGEPVVHDRPPEWQIGWGLHLRRGDDVTLLCTGTPLPLTLQAADELAAGGIDCDVLSLPSLCPLDTAAILESASRTGRVVTIEEHGRGALAEMTAETLLAGGVAARFQAVLLPREPLTVAGSHAYLRGRAGVDVLDIVRAVCGLAVLPSPPLWGRAVGGEGVAMPQAPSPLAPLPRSGGEGRRRHHSY
jgi:transketolase